MLISTWHFLYYAGLLFKWLVDNNVDNLYHSVLIYSAEENYWENTFLHRTGLGHVNLDS